LTSPELSYVRNHGPVPEVLDAEVLDWEFSVEGYDDEVLLSDDALLMHVQTGQGAIHD
jgi:hypothetical protein